MGTQQLLEFPIPLPHPHPRQPSQSKKGLNQGFPFSPQALHCLTAQWMMRAGPGYHCAPWFSALGTVERVGQPGGCWLPWEHQVWERVHPVIIRGAEARGYSPATLHLGFLALCPTAAPPGCVGMVVILGGGASSQHWKLLSSKRYCAWCSNSQAAPCYSQSDLMCELTGCSQQPWQGWNPLSQMRQ